MGSDSSLFNTPRTVPLLHLLLLVYDIYVSPYSLFDHGTVSVPARSLV